ncbi:MAG TPA: hypothetical protein VGR44_03825, partial [Methylomirabilota bacterium]|nr:hypothetical protein [Methylomirabilota bacterium]
GSDATAHGMETGQFLIGDPDTLTENILAQRAATGAGVLVIRPELGHMSIQEVQEGMELFAREVLPVVHQEVPSPSGRGRR